MSDPKQNIVDEEFVDSFFGGIPAEPLAPIVTEEKDEEPPAPVFKHETTDAPLKDLFDLTEEETSVIVDDDLSINPPASTKKEPSGDSSNLTTAVSELIKEGLLIPFDDEKFEVKSVADLKELIMANRDAWKEESIEESFQETFNSLPHELKYAIEYAQNGGSDFKGLFKALSGTQEIVSLNPDKDAKEINRVYLTYTNFGTPDEIEEQLKEWEDLELLEKKAKLFHPKLEKLKDEEVKEKIKEQQELREYQKQLVDQYFKGVGEALKDKDLNGIPLTKEEQGVLYTSLTQNNHVSSRTGQPINFLGKFLEKITWDEPDYKTLAELTLFAKDPEAYKNKIRESAKQEVVGNTVRKLKTAQGGLKITSQEENEPGKVVLPKKTITRNSLLKK